MKSEVVHDEKYHCRHATSAFLASVAALAIIAASSSAASSQAVSWDVPVQWPDGNFMTQLIKEYAETVSERSGGEIRLNVQSGGSLGIAGSEMLGAIRDGIFSIGEYSLAQAIGVEPVFGLERLPGLYESYEAFAIFNAVARPVYQQKLRDHNQIILMNVPWPQSHLHINVEIDSLEDLAGRRIRTYDPFGTEFYERLGASPVQMPWSEVVPSLASGVLEGVHTSASSAVDGHFWEFLSNSELLYAQSSTSALVISTSALEELSKEHRDIIIQTAQEMEIGFWLQSQADEVANIKKLQESGMSVDLAPDDVRDAAFVASKEIAEDFAEETPDAAAILRDYYQLRSASVGDNLD